MARLEAVIGSSHLSNFMKNPRLAAGADTTFITKNATRSPLKFSLNMSDHKLTVECVVIK